MAKFRDSYVTAEGKAAAQRQPPDEKASMRSSTAEPADVRDRHIGDILSDLRSLTPDQVEEILQTQRDKGIRFGEAAVQMGYASVDDVMSALAQQFHYPYAPEEQRKAAPELVALNLPFSQQAEVFRAVRSQLLLRVFDDQTQPRRALAVLSSDAGAGKTFFAVNLAVTLAQLGGRTLLVDADLRSPRIHEVFNLENRAGLSGILRGRAENNVISQVAGVQGLYVLPAGNKPPNPSELVERPAFRLLMQELISKFDHVLVDTPAACHGSDFAVIAARCGASLVVARKNVSRMVDIQDLLNTLAACPTKMAGVVVNEY